MDGIDQSLGTYADLRWEANSNDSRFRRARGYFDTIIPSDNRPRADAYEKRFRAFVSLLRAAIRDKDWVFYSDFNGSSHNINKWPINLRAVSDVRDWLLVAKWIVETSKRQRNRSARYYVPPKSKLRELEKLQMKKLPWDKPLVSVRRGRADLVRSPLDVEAMAKPENKAFIKKNLTPQIEDLNDKLLSHAFTFFPFGKPDEEICPEYCRIYTNSGGLNRKMILSHGRLYPRNFQFPSKQDGFRQMTLIDGQPTVEVDVHASSLTLLSNSCNYDFSLPATADYYQHGPLANYDRALIKTLVQSAINGVSLTQSKWPKSVLAENKLAMAVAKAEWKDVAGAILQVYPVLENLPKNTGVELMLVESDIILKAMNYLLDRGIGCLSIHDCLIVSGSNAGEAQDAFNKAYNAKGYNPPMLTLKGP